MKFNKQKAAMFGLDARIALAIFGAISVISGAALYQAVQQAKAIALLSDMREIGKAWEAYYLDTGESLTRNSNDNTNGHFYVYNIQHLVENPGIAEWKGPYLNYEVHNIENLKYASNYLTILLLSFDSAWGDTILWNPAGFCTAGKKCGIWINIGGFRNESIAKILDDKVDGGDGPTLGKFKWYYTESSGVRNYRHTLNITAIKNPND